MKLYLILFLLAGVAIDAHAQQWTAIAPMNFPRAEAEAVQLHNGTILVVGGYANGTVTGTCEIYDRTTDTWHLTGSLNVPRFRFALNILPSGKVVALGGLTDLGKGTTNSCEVYDPDSGTWMQFGTLPESSENFPTTYLNDSTLIFLGGLDANNTTFVTASGEINSNPFGVTSISSMLIGVYSHIGVFLPKYNEIVVAGGAIGGLPGPYLISTQIYNLKSSSWTLGDSLLAPVADGNHHMDHLSDDRIIVPSGRIGPNEVTTMVQQFDPSTGVWSNPGNLQRPHFHCYSILVGNDSILTIGGAIDPAYTQDIVAYTDWYNCRNDSSWEGPDMIDPRHVYAAVNAIYPISGMCSDSAIIYVFGGETTGKVQINHCEKLVLGVIRDESAQVPPSLTLATTSQAVEQTGCDAIDTVVRLGVTGCGITSGMLDSAWLTGSPAFRITDARQAQRSIAASDSIALAYSGSGTDTAYLHLSYDVGTGPRDTVVQIVGRLASPLLGEPQQLHRESASAAFGNIDTLILGVDVSSAVNLDSLWPYLTDMAGTFAWDSSIATYAGYLAPSGWAITGLADRGDSVEFGIHKLSGPATSPLDLGTALFTPATNQLATSWVELPSFSITTGGQTVQLCATDNEDNHWAVKTLGMLSGVSLTQSLPQVEEKLFLYPNPAGDELLAENPFPHSESIAIYDALGREMLRANAAALSTTALDVHPLATGIYFARWSDGSQVMVKE